MFLGVIGEAGRSRERAVGIAFGYNVTGAYRSIVARMLRPY